MKLSLAIVLLVCSVASGQTVTLPKEVVGGVSAFIPVSAETDGEIVKWKALDAGLNVFPADLLRSTKTTIVISPKAGRYRLLAYTAKDNIPSDPAETVVIVGDDPGPTPPVPPVPPTPPDPPPVPPADFLALTKAVAALAKDKPQDQKALVKKVYETTGAESHATIKGRVDVTAKALEEGLGFNAYDDWYDFRLGLAKELSKLKASGALTESNHGKCWLAIAEGLK